MVLKLHGFPFLKISKAKAMPLNFRGIIAPIFQEKFLCVIFLSGSAFYLSAFILSGSALYGELWPCGVSPDYRSLALLRRSRPHRLFLFFYLTSYKINNIEQGMNWRKTKKQNGKQAK